MSFSLSQAKICSGPDILHRLADAVEEHNV